MNKTSLRFAWIKFHSSHYMFFSRVKPNTRKNHNSDVHSIFHRQYFFHGNIFPSRINPLNIYDVRSFRCTDQFINCSSVYACTEECRWCLIQWILNALITLAPFHNDLIFDYLFYYWNAFFSRNFQLNWQTQGAASEFNFSDIVDNHMLTIVRFLFNFNVHLSTQSLAQVNGVCCH